MLFEGGADIGERLLDGLPRQAEHEVEIEVVEARCARGVRGGQRLVTPVDAPEGFQFVVVETLDADREPVHAGIAEAFEAFDIHGAGIGFERDFGIRRDLDPGADAFEQARDGLR